MPSLKFQIMSSTSSAQILDPKHGKGDGFGVSRDGFFAEGREMQGSDI